MIDLQVKIEDGGLDADLRAFVLGMKTKDQLGAMKEGAESARLAAQRYHEIYQKRGGWKGNRYLGPGPNSKKFGEEIQNRWEVGEITNNGIEITNDAPFLGQKVRGGTITPIRATALTIPMVSEAHGLRVAEYIRRTGNRLFRVPGKKALFEALPGKQGIRAVYALVKQVTQAPWPGALPDDESLTTGFRTGYRAAIIRALTKEVEQ